MSKTSEAAAVAMKPWLKWAWYHHSLTLHEFDSFEEAVASTLDADESLMAIEGPDGEVPEDIFEAEQARQQQVAWDAIKVGPKHTHGVRIYGPHVSDRDKDRAWRWANTFPSEAEAESLADALRSRFGERVKVVALR